MEIKNVKDLADRGRWNSFLDQNPEVTVTLSMRELIGTARIVGATCHNERREKHGMSGQTADDMSNLFWRVDRILVNNQLDEYNMRNEEI